MGWHAWPCDATLRTDGCRDNPLISGGRSNRFCAFDQLRCPGNLSFVVVCLDETKECHRGTRLVLVDMLLQCSIVISDAESDNQRRPRHHFIES